MGGDGLPLRAATGLDKFIYLASVVIALGSLLTMFVALLLEVVVRYATNSGLGWPTELPNLLFPWLVMSGVVLAAQRGQHIAVTAILRSEERRVGKECVLTVRSRGWPYNSKTKQIH